MNERNEIDIITDMLKARRAGYEQAINKAIRNHEEHCGVCLDEHLCHEMEDLQKLKGEGL